MAKLLVRYICNGNVIVDSFPGECSECLVAVGGNFTKKCLRGGDMRRIFASLAETESLILCSNAKDDIRNPDRMNSKAEAVPISLRGMEDHVVDMRLRMESTYRRLFHNISSLNAHIMQEIYALVDQSVMEQHAREQLGLVDKLIKTRSRNASLAILNIMKYNASIKTEIDVFQRLFRSDARLEIKSHKIHMALLNNLHIFFQDFTDKNIYVRIAPCDDYVFIDFDAFRVALHHFFLNAVKFTLANSNIDITFDRSQGFVVMTVVMTSLKILPEEIEELWKEGKSGKYAIEAKQKGDGIGMGIIQDILIRNKGSFVVIPSTESSLYEDIPYSKNTFVFNLVLDPSRSVMRHR